MGYTITERREDRDGTEEAGQRTRQRKFMVVTSTASDTAEQILKATGLPLIGDTFPSNSGLLCKRLRASTGEDVLHWYVTAEYELSKGTLNHTGSNDPWQLPADIRFDFVVREKPAEHCYFRWTSLQSPPSGTIVEGSPNVEVVNSAFDTWNPPLPEDDNHMLIIITRNERKGDFNPNTMASFQDTINSDMVKIAGVAIAPYQGRLCRVQPVKMFTGDGVVYWQVTYEIEINRETWVRRVLDQGFHKCTNNTGAGKKAIAYTDIGGTSSLDVTEMQKLNGSGGVLAQNGTPVWMKYLTKWPKAWATLKLPASEDDS